MLNFKVNGQEYSLQEEVIVDLFHHIYYESRVWERTSWFGHQILKNPLDMWLYQELLVATQPNFLVESGTFRGGSALFYAHMFDLLGKGEVITVDVIPQERRPNHPRIRYLHGSSTDDNVISNVLEITGGNLPLVILDADHSKEHVLAELAFWSPHISRGGHLIVEDSNINGHPVRPDFGPGPYEAIVDFLKANSDFAHDTYFDKFFVTQNPRGWLKRLP